MVYDEGGVYLFELCSEEVTQCQHFICVTRWMEDSINVAFCQKKKHRALSLFEKEKNIYMGKSSFQYSYILHGYSINSCFFNMLADVTDRNLVLFFGSFSK